MSARPDSAYLADIQEAARRIRDYIAVMTYEEFRGDIRTQDAVMRNLEIIGKATKNISVSFRKQYSAIPWKQMAALRDRLIHHYFGVNLDIVWNVITTELPEVALQIDTARKNYLF